MKIEYRLLDKRDIDLLTELRIRDLILFQDQPVSDYTKRKIHEFYTEKVNNNQCHTIAGYQEDRIVATATIYYYDILPSNENPSGRVGQITNVWVEESLRHQGIARFMVSELIEQYKGDVGMICLNSSDAGMNLYLKLGFLPKENHLILKV